jgi:8-oxo-dGTP pyrophosphatase MutT (NUDIX family)
MQAQRIKARALHGLAPEDAINAFQWCKARLTKELPEGLLAVQRFEADSKFFRSFFVVLGALALIYAHRENRIAATLCFAAMLPALWRYIDQRFKATQQAYWFVIALEAMKTDRPAALPPREEDGLSLAGGVVYRRRMVEKVETVEFMLVEASRQPLEWVLPKGHIEPGESPRITAVREVQEETDCWAMVTGWLVYGRLDKGDAGAPLVRWFLLELCEEPAAPPWPPDSRRHIWLSFTDAKQVARFPEAKALLGCAGRELKLR